MTRKEFIFLVILATISLSSATGEYYKVKFVYDGDTILLDGRDKVRYLGINAPEIDHEGGKAEFMAQAARDFNLKLVNGAQVRLEYDREKRDRHGRLLAYVFLENGDMVNTVLLRKGLAHVMLKNRNLKYKDFLLESQRMAMKERLGIWSKALKEEQKFYLGNRNSYRFHRPTCPFAGKISRPNVVRFKSCHDAFWEGYSPCRQCTP
jgi:endonuclease YncB( thermonuclease family)